MSWRDLAACRDTDPDLWFSKRHGASYDSRRFDAARAICAECPVLRDCRQWSLEQPLAEIPYGIFAGMTPDDRRRIRRNRRRRRKDAA